MARSITESLPSRAPLSVSDPLWFVLSALPDSLSVYDRGRCTLHRSHVRYDHRGRIRQPLLFAYVGCSGQAVRITSS